ncbi:MAG: HAMP domain-containing protein [Lewinellaceae bacterium]|nr:HAMP domain-containing protein [Lewinellaceae bacterium]
MSLRLRLALWFSIFVQILLSIVFVIIYLQSAEFRQDEFYERLQQKALTTQRLLLDVQGVDSALLRIIDRNTFTTLPKENVQVFLDNDQLVYSSEDDPQMNTVDTLFLAAVRSNKDLQFTDPSTKKQSIGLLVENERVKSVVIASAYDLYGYRKLSNLRYVLIGTWMLSFFLSVLLAYLYVKEIVGRPLSALTVQVASIGEEDLSSRIMVPENQDELTLLAENFNALLERVEKAFEAQRNFLQYASHELRTPLANMLSETDNALSKERDAATYQQALLSLREEQTRLAELMNSLLMLTRSEDKNMGQRESATRIDEVLFYTIEEVKTAFPEYNITLDFVHIPDNESDLAIQAVEPLLRSAFRNLLENGCRYASDNTVKILIESTKKSLLVQFVNKGAVLSEQEARVLFTPFFRGGNTTGKKGFGLGLVIARRILSMHSASL